MAVSINRKNIFKNTIPLLILVIICTATLLLSLPTIDNNIGDPNMIVYFNADEGGLMDVIWHYYSGVKRDSFQWDFDYGLEMRYLADLARSVLSKFIDFTPGTLVLILRWIHLIAWILSLLALWRLVSYHFGKAWQPILAVSLLATRPAFGYFLNNLKPEPLVLFFVIVGLDYTLRVIESASRRDLVIAIACASIAFVIKFAGVFLLPAVVASMYFSKRYQRSINEDRLPYPTIKTSWIFPALFGVLIMAFLFMVFAFYVRKSTGSSWYAEFGFWGSLLQNRMAFCLFLVAIAFVITSCVIYILNRRKTTAFKEIVEWVNEINSYSFIVFAIFLGTLLLFGFRWLMNPKHFIAIYAQLGPIARAGRPLSLMLENNFFYSIFQNIVARIKDADPIILFLMFFFIIIERYFRAKAPVQSDLKFYKRLVLLIFLIPFFTLMPTRFRFAQHNMLPFFTVISILAIQGFFIFTKAFSGKRFIKGCVSVFVSMLFLIDVVINGNALVRSRIYHFRQYEDVAFDIAKWWRENVPVDAFIVADHYNRAYIPPEYENVKTTSWNQALRPEELRRLVYTYHPQFIYYDAGPTDTGVMPPIEELLPGKRMRLIKAFESSRRRYQRYPNAKYVIYSVSY